MHWHHLHRGDIVDIIAPASHAPLHDLEQGIDWLNAIGLIPRVPEKIINPDLFFASSLKEQIKQFKDALYSDSKAIWCLRGGYGSMRLIPYLKKLTPPKRPKIFIGYSDITALHLFLNQDWKWPTIHGRNIGQMDILKKNTADYKEMRKIIFGEMDEKNFNTLRPLNESALQTKKISGKIIGGNLCMILTSLGTPWEINPKGKILFIEDIAERGYRVDRMLEQLFQAGIINTALKALIIGDFTDGFEKDGTSLIDDALSRFAKRVKYPVLKGLPCGHGKTKNHPLPLNTTCLLTTGPRSSITCKF